MSDQTDQMTGQLPQFLAPNTSEKKKGSQWPTQIFVDHVSVAVFCLSPLHVYGQVGSSHASVTTGTAYTCKRVCTYTHILYMYVAVYTYKTAQPLLGRSLQTSAAAGLASLPPRLRVRASACSPAYTRAGVVGARSLSDTHHSL